MSGVPKLEGPGSPDPALRPCMGAKVGGAGLPGPCPTASGNVGGLRPALPMSETFGLPRVLCRSPSVINGCQSWRDRAPRSLPYGQWKCRRPSACPARVGDHRSVQGFASLTFCHVWVPKLEGPGSPAPALRPVEKSEAFGLPCPRRRPSVCPGSCITHLLS